MIDANFKFYKQITDDDDFSAHFIGWLFERYYKKKTEGDSVCIQGVQAHTTLQAEGRERGYHQADEPLAADRCFPPRGLWRGASSGERVPETVSTTLGETGLLGDRAQAVCPLGTKIFDQTKTSLPKSPVGRSSAGA